ncbi:MAG: hypothetical protein WC545_02915 [Patescibacteria group bacterium]
MDKKLKKLALVIVAAAIGLLIAWLVSGCELEEKWKEEQVFLDNDTALTFINNDLVLSVLINGQRIDTVYTNVPFRVSVDVNMYAVDSYAVRIAGQTFLADDFTTSLSAVGVYPIGVMATNGGRTFKDSTSSVIYAVEYSPVTVWLPGLWGDNSDTARFRIGLDTLFFNAAYCLTRPIPYVVFGDSLDHNSQQIVFSYDWIELLNFYNQSWYYLAMDNLPYWLDTDRGQFLFIRYGGDFHNPDSSLANMAGGTLNEDLGCYVLKTSLIHWPGL